MVELGGYFAVCYVAEHVLVDGLDAAFRAGWEQLAGAAQWGTNTPFGRLEARGAASIDKPTIALDGAGNVAVVGLSAAARFDLTLDGSVAGGVFIEAVTEAAVPVHVSQDERFNKVVVDLSKLVLQPPELRLTWFDAPPDARSEAALLSPETRKALTDELFHQLEPFLTFRIPRSDEVWIAEVVLSTKGNPGSVVFTPQIQAGEARVLDGWLALGINAKSSTSPSTGDPDLIGPPPEAPPRVGAAIMPEADEGDGSLRLVIDRAMLLRYLTLNAQFAVQFEAAKRPNFHPVADPDEPLLPLIGVDLVDDAIVIRAAGTINAPDPFPGTLPFDATIQVRLFVAKRTPTVYASVHPDIKVDSPLYLQVLAAIGDFFGADTFAELNRANKSSWVALFPAAVKSGVPEFSELRAGIEARRVVLRPDMVAIYGEAKLSTWSSGPPDDLTPKIWPSVPIRDRFLTLRLDSFGRFVKDPTWRIRYLIRRISDGAEVDTGVAWAGPDPFGGPIDLWDDANYLETEFAVELVAERPPGQVRARSTESLKVLDLFDRSHPFARWRKTHFFVRGQSSIRLSAIHRTAIRERCAFGDTGTLRKRATYVMEALDSVPAPTEDGFSDRLCRYCFPDV